MAITVNGTTITFNDGTTQTTAGVTAPANGALGSVEWLVCSSSSSSIYNGTVSGSNLFYISSLNGGTPQNNSFSVGQSTGLVPSGDRRNASASFTASTLYWTGPAITYTNLSGTWRAVSFYRHPTFYDGYANNTYMFAGLFIRIS